MRSSDCGIQEAHGGWKPSLRQRPGLASELAATRAGLAEFKRDLSRASVKSGLATARVRGIMHGDGLSLSLIRRNLEITNHRV